MDDLDRRLIARLAGVTRLGVLELSRRLGVARGTVQARLDRLHGAGVMTGFGPDVDLPCPRLHRAGLHHDRDRPGPDAAVIVALAAIPEVLEVHKTTGPGDLLCRIVARTNEHLHEVLNRVLGHAGIVRTTTVLALASPVQRAVAYVLPDALLDDVG